MMYDIIIEFILLKNLIRIGKAYTNTYNYNACLFFFYFSHKNGHDNT